MGLTVLLLTILFAALFVGTFWNPTLGVLGYLAVYVFHNPLVWWGRGFLTFRPSLVAVILLTLSCVLHRNRLEWNISRREIQFYCFLGVTWFTSLVFGVGLHEIAWTYLMKMTKLFVFVFLLLRVVHSLDRYKLVIWGFVLSGLFLAYQAHLVGRFVDGRLDNLGGIDFREANGLASFLVFATISLGFWLFRASWGRKALYVMAIAVMADAIIMTQSRAVFLGIFLATPFVLLRTPMRCQKQLWLYCLCGVILFFTLSDVKFSDRMSSIKENAKLVLSQNAKHQDTRINRLDFWKASFRMFADHPLGIGVKNFEKEVPRYDPRNPGKDAHNTYVLCYSEIGIIGIGLFITIILEALFQLRRVGRMVIDEERREEVKLLAVSLNTVLLIYLLGIMMTHSNLYSEILWILLALPICLENAARKLVVTSSEEVEEETMSGDDLA